MKFTPKTESQLKDEALLPVGEYFFTIAGAENKVSKAGNEMIALKLEIWNGEKKIGVIFDYLIESMGFKLRHCCDVCGLINKYNAGTLEADDFIGANGNCKVDIQPAKDGFDPKNIIRDYIKGNENSPTRDESRPVQDDGLPF